MTKFEKVLTVLKAVGDVCAAVNGHEGSPRTLNLVETVRTDGNTTVVRWHMCVGSRRMTDNTALVLGRCAHCGENVR